MADATYKALTLTDFLERTAGRSSAIKADKCIPRPFGCGGPAKDFRNDLARREYRISGLCQKCQDLFFGE